MPISDLPKPKHFIGWRTLKKAKSEEFVATLERSSNPDLFDFAFCESLSVKLSKIRKFNWRLVIIQTGFLLYLSALVVPDKLEISLLGITTNISNTSRDIIVIFYSIILFTTSLIEFYASHIESTIKTFLSHAIKDKAELQIASLRYLDSGFLDGVSVQTLQTDEHWIGATQNLFLTLMIAILIAFTLYIFMSIYVSILIFIEIFQNFDDSLLSIISILFVSTATVFSFLLLIIRAPLPYVSYRGFNEVQSIKLTRPADYAEWMSEYSKLRKKSARTKLAAASVVAFLLPLSLSVDLQAFDQAQALSFAIFCLAGVGAAITLVPKIVLFTEETIDNRFFQLHPNANFDDPSHFRAYNKNKKKQKIITIFIYISILLLTYFIYPIYMNATFIFF